MKIRFERGLDFILKNYLSPTKPEISEISQNLHGASVSKIVFKIGHLPHRNYKNSNKARSGFRLKKLAKS